MKPKQTLLFILLNILGYSTLASGIYFYLSSNVEMSAISSVIGLIIIYLSFKVGLKVINPFEKNQDDATIIDEEVMHEIVPISHIEAEESVSEPASNEDINELQPTHFENNNIIELLAHYSKFDDNKESNIISSHVDTIEMLEINLKNLSEKMDTYGLVNKNPLFNYRFEALLKLGVSDTKIWENLYDLVPYVDIVEQYIETMNRSVYLVRASINEKTRSNIGYLPINLDLKLKNIDSIEGTLIGGKYNYLNNEDSSFNTFESPLKLHIRIQTK